MDVSIKEKVLFCDRHKWNYLESVGSCQHCDEEGIKSNVILSDKRSSALPDTVTSSPMPTVKPPRLQSLNPPRQESNEAGLVRMAVEQNFDIDKLEKVIALHVAAEKRQAKKDFFEAFAKFQADCPEILQTGKVDYTPTGKARVHYPFASLSDIEKAIKIPLAGNNLSYRWVYSKTDKGALGSTCILTHASGHSESNYMEGPPDTSGNKNPLKAASSTYSHLDRYTLKGSLGLASTEQDTDMAGDEPKTRSTFFINDKQLEQINQYADEYPKAISLLLKKYKLELLSALPERQFDEAIGALKTYKAGADKIRAEKADKDMK